MIVRHADEAGAAGVVIDAAHVLETNAPVPTVGLERKNTLPDLQLRTSRRRGALARVSPELEALGFVAADKLDLPLRART